MGALSEVQQKFYRGLQQRSLLDVWAAIIFETVDLVLLWFVVDNLC
jgi:hypothetical protein